MMNVCNTVLISESVEHVLEPLLGAGVDTTLIYRNDVVLVKCRPLKYIKMISVCDII